MASKAASARRAKALLALAQGRLAPLQLGDVDPHGRDPAVAQAMPAGRDPAVARKPLLDETAIGRGMALERLAHPRFAIVVVAERAELERPADQGLVGGAGSDRAFAAQIAVFAVAHMQPAVGIEDGEAVVERLERVGEQLMLRRRLDGRNSPALLRLHGGSLSLRRHGRQMSGRRPKNPLIAALIPRRQTRPVASAERLDRCCGKSLPRPA